MVRNYFTVAWRNITRHKVYALINVLGLALGMGACLIVYLIACFDVSFDTFHPDAARVYRVVAQTHWKTGGVWYLNQIAPPVPAAMQAQLTGVEKVAGFHLFKGARIRIPGGTKPTSELSGDQPGGGTGVIVAGPEYFNIFAYTWLAGSAATALQEPFGLVLAESKARRYFGPGSLEKVLGREVLYNDSLRVKITGIVKDWEQNTDLAFTDFISPATVARSFLKDVFTPGDWDNRHGSSTMAFVKLSPGTAPGQIEKQLTRLVDTHMQVAPNKYRLHLQLLADIHFNANYAEYPIRKAHLPTLYALMGAALFVLLIAVMNFVNLSTAQSIGRAKGIGVRKVLGSTRRGLVFQFLAETWLLALFALAVSILLAGPVLSAFDSFIPEGIRFDPFRPGTLIFLLLITLVTAAGAGFYPARVLSGYSPVQTLRGNGAPRGGQQWYLRKGLIVGQFAISLLFIIGSLVISHQIHYMRTKDLGFAPSRVVNFRPNQGDNSIQVQGFAQQLAGIPGVEDVLMESAPPMGFLRMEMEVTHQGKDEHAFFVSFRPGNEGFIPFYGIKVRAGRNLVRSDTLTEIVINESCAKAMGYLRPAEAVGKLLHIKGQPVPVVGVVEDFHQFSFYEPILPTVIGNVPGLQRNVAIKLSVTAGGGSIQATLSRIAQQWKSRYPDVPLPYSFLTDSIAAEHEKERRTGWLVNIVMGVTIFISCIGLFGLTMFTAGQRKREMGIRKVLGATVGNLVALMSRELVLLILVALLIASPLAWYLMERWLEDFAYKVRIEWWIFVLAGTGAVLVALLTTSSLTFQAASANPVDSLRSE